MDEKCKNYVLAGKSLVKEEGILFNGYDRVSMRNYLYYNHVQPYQHFEVSPDEGINTYSFSIEPDKFQPSGSCNSSYVGLTEIRMSLNHIVNDKNTAVFKGYSLAHNVFRIIDGLGGLVFIR